MSLTLEEARSRAAALSDLSYTVDLDLTGWEAGTFGVDTTVRLRTASPDTFLELTAAQDVTVAVDGVAREPAYDGRRITLAGLPTGVPVEVRVTARVPYVSDGDGMHLATDPADGATYASAYLGMDVTQRVLPCFDQVDLKAPVSMSVTAEAGWTVLANARPESREEVGGTAVRWCFATTPPVPLDQLVVCAGPWHSVTWEHAGLPFGWHARASLAADLDRDAAELVATTTACFDHYAGLFAEPYAFDSYDQVFVPGQNWGALETPGCVTYRDELLPRGRTTARATAQRATVIAHEMAHMWFGNLVTMRWWEDTWLNESFADYLGYRVAEAGAGFAGALVAHEAGRKPAAYDADQRRSSHPVAPLAEDVPDVDSAFANFDALSYAKGNSCLRQLVTWLGDEDFLSGVDAHLTRHRFGNASLADLVASLDEASPRDVRGWAERWLRTPGFDTVLVERPEEGGDPLLRREGVRPHRLRVTAYDEHTWAEVATRLVDLEDDPVRLEGWGAHVVVPNAHGETFARLRLDARSWDAVAAGLGSLPDPLTRAVLWATAFERVQARDLPVDDYLALVARHLPVERDVALVQAVLRRTLDTVVVRSVPPARAAEAVETVAAACRAGLDALAQGGAPDGAAGLERAIVLTEGLAATSHDPGLLRAWLDAGRTAQGVELDPALRWSVVGRLAALGAADAALVAAERRADPSVAGELGAAAALAARPTAEAKAEAWAAAADDDRVSNRMFEALVGGMWSPEQADLLAPWVSRYLEQGPLLAARRGQAFGAVVGLRSFPRVALSPAQVQQLETALTGSLPTVLRRHWEDRLDDLRAGTEAPST